MKSKGVTKEQTILIPAFFAAGMLLFSNYAGRLGDRRGHLGVMRVLATIGLSMILAFVLLDSYAWMCLAVFVAGASLASISPVSLALQGVISSEYGRATRRSTTRFTRSGSCSDRWCRACCSRPKAAPRCWFIWP